MTTTKSIGLRRLSADVSRSVGEEVLLKLVLHAVQSADGARLKEEESKVLGFRPQMVLTLLTYCYAARIYGSRDIEWAMMHDRTARYICARKFPNWQTLRRFRRRNRELLADCLTDVFEQAWALEFEQGDALSDGYEGFQGPFSAELRAEAISRLDIAALHDGAESD